MCGASITFIACIGVALLAGVTFFGIEMWITASCWRATANRTEAQLKAMVTERDAALDRGDAARSALDQISKFTGWRYRG